jgi:hypothetical protein
MNLPRDLISMRSILALVFQDPADRCPCSFMQLGSAFLKERGNI